MYFNKIIFSYFCTNKNYNKKNMRTTIIILGLLFFTTMQAQDITLPQPVKTGGMPLMEALSKRSSSREFSPEKLDNQTLSNLLWAAWGYNREDKRTAPTANDRQEIDLYVVMESGAYLYDARANKLIFVTKEDVRANTGKQDFAGTAPLNIVFVADKTKEGAPHTDSGFISQNIYLYCASEGLATVVRGWFDADEVKKALNLNDTQSVVLTQTVGKKK